MTKQPSLKDELKKKFGSPRACIEALGLDANLLNVTRLAFDGANQMKPNRLQAILVTSAARIFNPQLALDAKDVNYGKLFAGVTSKNLKARRPTIVADAKKLLKGKTVAKDASVEGLGALLDQLEKEPKTSLDESVSEAQHKAMEAAANGRSTLGIPREVGEEFARADEQGKHFDAIPEFLKGRGVDESVIKDCMDMLQRGAKDETSEEAADESEEEREEREKKEAEDKAAKDEAERKEREAADRAAKDEAEKEEEERRKKEATDRRAKDSKHARDAAMVTQDAVDKAVASAIATERKRTAKTNEARAFVRPYVGELSMGLDSAEDVYRAAAVALEIEDAESIHASALPTLIKQLGRKAGAQNLNTGHESMAHDTAASVADAYELFPEARRIR